MTPEAQGPERDARAPKSSPRSLWRRRWVWVLAVMFLLLAVDLTRPPNRQLTTRTILSGVDFYQAHVSRRLGDAKCRFAPTCSVYVEISIRKHGLLKGGLRGAWRLMRCGPWSERGTRDEP